MAPNVTAVGCTLIDNRCWLWAQLERPVRKVAAAIRAIRLNHFRCMQRLLERANLFKGAAKSKRGTYLVTVSATNFAKSFTSFSVVSKEHIQRTIDSSSIHM